MIRSIWLKNAGPFRGVHRVDLKPMAYAITARYEADPGLSNGGGKSFLVEMIDFPLTGNLKSSRRFDADGWITKGEREGYAGVELEDGTAIVRSRRRGKATQIRFMRITNDAEREDFFRVMSLEDRPPPGCAAQADAEVEMLKYLGFSSDDFRNVAYFESKKMARLIHTPPEKRLDIVRGWLGIEKAERAEDLAQQAVTKAVRRLKELRTRRAIVEERLKVVGKPSPTKPYEEQRDQADRDLVDLRAEIESLRGRHAEMRSAEQVVRSFDAFVAQGKKLAAEVEKLAPIEQLDSNLAQAISIRDTARSAWDAAKLEVQSRHRVSLGMFDGRCPVADIECPAKKKINDDRATARDAFERAKLAEEKARRSLDVCERDAHQAAEEYDDAREKIDELTAARAEAKEIAESVKTARKLLKQATSLPDEDALYERERELRTARDNAVQAIAQVRADNKHYELLVAQQKEIEEETKRVLKAVAIETQTRAVFRSTQRRVSETALGRIGTRANEMLLAGGINLGIDVRWEYEGKSLAGACEDCGAAFPKSAKVKTCEECGADRGLNIIRKLEFLRTDQSDGLDDLAGVSLQLSAGSWLLAARQSPWATAILDEPLAAVDKSNRRAIAQQLAKMLGAGTWRQAIVISHSSDTVDAFPGRIEIVVAKDGTRHIRQP